MQNRTASFSRLSDFSAGREARTMGWCSVRAMRGNECAAHPLALMRATVPNAGPMANHAIPTGQHLAGEC